MGKTALSQDQKRSIRLISFPFLYAVLLLALPLGAIFLFSFWTQDGNALDTTFTLENYREILQLERAQKNIDKLAEDAGLWATVQAFFNTPYLTLLGRSLYVSGIVTIITVITAFPIAYFVSFHVHPARKSLWLFLITIPFWTSYLIRIFLWKVILGYNGVINSSLISLNIIDEPLTFILYNLNAVIIALAHAFAPFAILPIFVALEKIDRSLLEAAQDLGENRWMTFLRVTLPLAMPGVIAAVLIVFIPTIGDYVTPVLMGGSGGQLIANMIQVQFLQLNNAPFGAALALVAMVCVAAISLLIVRLNRRYLKGRS
jgi:spermidine/putrescine transport system permease protein